MDLTFLRHQLHQQIIDHPRMMQLVKLPEDNKRRVLKSWIQDSLIAHQSTLTKEQTEELSHDLENEILGLGPLEALLLDPTISDILVNGPKQIYVEKQGQLILHTATFDDAHHVKHTIDKIISPLGRRLDESHPMVDARLKDGSRLNAILPPLAINGPILSIRRFNHGQNIHFTQLINHHSLTKAMADLCSSYVEQGANILVSGGTGSGKTTFLNILASQIPTHERVITIEDAAELRIRHPHIVSLETKPANTEGEKEITGEQLLKNALRMRPNRILFGELRGREAWDLMQAMNTGHPGSMTTIHANSAQHALIRLEQLIVSFHDYSASKLNDQLKQTLDVVIHLERTSSGQRRVVSINELHPKKQSALVPLYYFNGTDFIRTSRQSKYHSLTSRIFL